MSRMLNAHVNFNARDNLSSPMARMRQAATRTMRSIANAARSANKQIQMLNKGVNKMFGGIGRMLPGAGLLSGASIFIGAKRSIETFAEVEAMSNSIVYASDNAAEGAKNMSFLRDITQKLGLDFRASATGFKMFAASMMGSKFKSADARTMFEDISGGIAVMGLEADKTEAVFRALGEMVSKGQIMSQELKTQLGNALPAAVKDLADSMGIAKDKLLSLMEKKGGVDPEKVLMSFTAFLRKKYSAGLDIASKQTTAVLGRIRTAWYFAMSDIGESIVSSGILDHIGNILKATSEWIKANKILIGVKLKEVVDKVVQFGKWVVTNWESISKGLKFIGKAILLIKTAAATANLMILLANPVGALAIAAVAAAAGIWEIYDALPELSSRAKDIRDVFSPLENLMLGIGNILFAGDNNSTWLDNLQQRLIGILQVAASVFQFIGYVAKSIGAISEADYADVIAKTDSFVKRAQSKIFETQVYRHNELLNKSTQTSHPVTTSLIPSYLKDQKKPEMFGISPFKNEYLQGDNNTNNSNVNIIITKQEGIDVNYTTSGAKKPTVTTQ